MAKYSIIEESNYIIDKIWYMISMAKNSKVEFLKSQKQTFIN